MTARTYAADTRADYPRDLSKVSPRASLGIANARADLDAVYRALLYTKPSTVAELQRLLDAPGLRSGITENRVQASLFLLREHGMAEGDYSDDWAAVDRFGAGAWTRKDPS